MTATLPVELSKFTQPHVLDVGDVPGHQVRLFEVHRTYSKDLLADALQSTLRLSGAAERQRSAA